MKPICYSMPVIVEISVEEMSISFSFVPFFIFLSFSSRLKFATFLFFMPLRLKAGGDAFGRPTNTMECFNLKTEKWETFPAMNFHRRRCAAVSVGEKLVVAGGLTLGDYSMDSMEMFDLRNRKWFDLPNMPYPRFGCGSCVVNSQMFLIGGNEKLWMKAYSNRLDSFDVMSQEWDVLPSMAQRRLHPAAVHISL